MKDREFNERLKREMKARFPWLGTDEESDGADDLDRIAEWYQELG